MRVAKAHTRLMGRRAVTLLDAVVAVQMAEVSLSGDFAAREGFPACPDDDAWESVAGILQELGLEGLLPEAQRQRDLRWIIDVPRGSDDSDDSDAVSVSAELGQQQPRGVRAAASGDLERRWQEEHADGKDHDDERTLAAPRSPRSGITPPRLAEGSAARPAAAAARPAAFYGSELESLTSPMAATYARSDHHDHRRRHHHHHHNNVDDDAEAARQKEQHQLEALQRELDEQALAEAEEDGAEEDRDGRGRSRREDTKPGLLLARMTQPLHVERTQARPPARTRPAEPAGNIFAGLSDDDDEDNDAFV
jgi:hypothetical protein